MRSFGPMLVGVALCLSVSVTFAQTTDPSHYRWTDKQGVVQMSDSLSSEGIAQGYEVVNSHGLVMARVPRTLTAEERVAKKAADATAAAAAKKAADQKTQDERFLAAYPTDKEVVAMQQEVLSNLDGQIQTTKMNLKSQQDTLSNLLSRAGEIETEKKPVPQFIADQIKKQQATVDQQKTMILHLEKERDQTVSTQHDQLLHHQALVAARDQVKAANVSP